MAIKDGIPTIPGVPRSFTPEQQRFLQAVVDASRIRFGQTKNNLERSITARELLEVGLLDKRGNVVQADAALLNENTEWNDVANTYNAPESGATANPFQTYTDIATRDLATVADGAYAYVAETEAYYIYQSGAWIEVADLTSFASVASFINIVYSPTPPANPVAWVADTTMGTIWIDTDDLPLQARIYDGSGWVIFSTVGAIQGADGNVLDASGAPVIDASASDRQQQALGVIATRVAFRTGNLSYAVFEAGGTDIYVSGTKVASALADGATGTIAVVEGDLIEATRPTALYDELSYSVPSFAQTGYRFLTVSTRGTSQEIKFYSPFGPAVVK